MYFFIATLITCTLLLLGSFASLINANAGLTMLTFCPFAGIVYPLFWIACYRMFSGYRVVKRG